MVGEKACVRLLVWDAERASEAMRYLAANYPECAA